jgi:hypothetical protein
MAIIQAAPVTRVRELVDRPLAFSILVRESVPPELVLEGMDPRLMVLALSVRGAPGAESNDGFVSGVAIYRRSLGRATRTAEEVELQLRHLLHEELAMGLGLGDAEREKLGLTPLEGRGRGPGRQHEP